MTTHSHMNTPSTSMNHYRRLLVMVLASFVAMYGLMYAMVNRFENVFNNVNQVYMATLMTASMVIIELALMWRMYYNTKRNVVIVAAAVVALLASWVFIRRQTGIGDREFLRSMIPHHAGAILMCGEAPIRDSEIKALCQEIITGQQREIEQMKTMLQRLSR